MVKTLQKTSSPEPADWFPWNIKWWPLVDLDLFYGKVKFGNILFYRKKWKQWIFQKPLQPEALKLADADNQLSWWRYVSIVGQGHFLTLAQAIYIWKLKLVLLRNNWPIFNQILYVSFQHVQVQGNENPWTWMLVTWPRWPPHPYMVKTFQKSSPESVDRFPGNDFNTSFTPTVRSCLTWHCTYVTYVYS